MRILTHEPDGMALSALWGTFVHKRTFAGHAAQRDAMLDVLFDLKAKGAGRGRGENIRLFESHYDLFDRLAGTACFRDFLAFARETFLDVAGRVNRDPWSRKGVTRDDVALRIVDSWFIEYSEQGFVLPHSHGGSWSCVYYLQKDPSAGAQNGATYLLSPRTKLDDRHDLGNSYLSNSSFVIEAEEGDLVIFPSHIVHGSLPTVGRTNKVIISANAEFVVSSNA